MMDSFVEDSFQEDSFVEDIPESESSTLSKLLGKLKEDREILGNPEQLAQQQQLSAQRVSRALTGGWSDKLGALKDALLSGDIGQEMDRVRQSATVSPPPLDRNNLPLDYESPGLLDGTMVGQAIRRLYNQNLDKRVIQQREFEQKEPLASTIVNLTGFGIGPFGKAGNIGKIVQSSRFPKLAAIGGEALGGATIMPAYMHGIAESGEDVSNPKAMMMGAGIGAASQAIPMIIKGGLGAAGRIGQGAQNFWERNIAAPAGAARREMFPDEFSGMRTGGTGSSLTQQLYNESRTHSVLLKGTGLSENMPLNEALDDSALRGQLVQVMQKVFRGRGRDAFDIPYDKMLESVESDMVANPALKGDTVGNYLSARLKMQPAQRLSYAEYGPEWQSMENVKTPLFQEVQAPLKELLGKVRSGELNRNLEDFSKFGTGSREAQIGGMSLTIPDEYAIAPGMFGNAKTQAQSDALRNLQNIVKGKESFRNEGMFLGPIQRGFDTAGYMGRKMEQLSETSPTKIANKVINSIPWLQRMSSNQGQVGEIARGALQDLQNGNHQAAQSKAFLLATSPDFRKMFGEQPEEPSAQPEALPSYLP